MAEPLVDVYIDLPDNIIDEIDSIVGAANRNAFLIAAAAERLRLLRAPDNAPGSPNAANEVDVTRDEPPHD